VAKTVSKGVVRAAGGVVWRPRRGNNGESSIEVALIHRPRYDDWSFPKGKLAPGESEIEGAIREVLEETGFHVRLGRPLGEIRYLKHSAESAREKVVRYWAMQFDGGSFSPTREVDEMRWVSLDEASRLLTHERDKEVLGRFVRGPKLGGCVLLVRHASAGSRSQGEGDDRLRPLDEVGWEQAEGLVRLLSRFKVTEVISANFVRCTQTVRPFADAVGLAVKEDPVFSELGYPGSENEAVEQIRALAASGDSSVVCSQGDVVPDVVRRLAESDHVSTQVPDPKKGSVIALTFDGERLFSAEYFPPVA
jgi:8-oxo-dGTP diphosphatase